jgi:uncharacterized damage-inducible protein DinB
MLDGLSLNHLMDYTDWERRKWHDCLARQGQQALEISAGPHGDGRFESVGELLRHIFSAEKRYVERLSHRPLTDVASIPKNNLEALFQFGRHSRKELKELIETLPATEWDAPRDFKILDYSVQASPQKIVLHVLMHEIRHWAQIGTLLRLHGVTDGFHDFLFSPVLGGGVSTERANA